MATAAPPRPAEALAVQPCVGPAQQAAELTIWTLILETKLGLFFAASSVDLALKIGLTVSASIPIAALAVAFSTLRPLDDPGEEYCPDDRLIGRVHRLDLLPRAPALTP